MKLSYFILTKSVGLYINTLQLFFPRKAFDLAYKLFSEPRKGRFSIQNLPDILKSSKMEEHRLTNQKFHTYTWAGNENTILLVHGWESNSARWEKLLPYLQKSGNTIVAIDGPAHGLSDVRNYNLLEYAEMIDLIARKTNPYILIGHSLGGKTCLYYQSVYNNPGIQKIVTLGAPSDFHIIYENFIRTISLNSTTAKALKDYYIHNFTVDFRDLAVEKYASDIKTQGLVVHDVEDKIVLPAEAEKINRCWKNSQLFTTRGLGHSMHDDSLYRKVSDFLFESHN